MQSQEKEHNHTPLIIGAVAVVALVVLYLVFVSIKGSNEVVGEAAIAATPGGNNRCYDSDGWSQLSADIKGFVDYKGKKYVDVCGEAPYQRDVIDYYCDSQGQPAQQWYSCGGGSCSDGDCSSGDTKCSDTDGGKNYNVGGVMHYGGTTYGDYCSTGRLIEYYCDELGRGPNYEVHPCTCKDGVSCLP